MKKKLSLLDFSDLEISHKFVTKLQNMRPDISLFVAGGAARDALLGKKIRDIDIFISFPVDEQDKFYFLMKDIETVCKEIDREFKVVDTSNYFSKSIMRLKIDNLDICITRLNYFDAESLVLDFDIVHSQAWLEPYEEGFIANSTQLFDILSEKKILGYYLEGSPVRSEYLAKLSDKFNDHYLLPLAKERADESLPF